MPNFDYYGNVARVIRDIRTYRKMLKNYEHERKNLILLCGPAPVKAMSYDQPNVQSSSHKEADLTVLKRIETLSEYITYYKIILKDKEETLKDLKDLGNKYLKKIESRGKEDLKLRVFMLAYIDGKSNDQIKDEIPGYEMQSIWNVKTQINKYFSEELLN